MTTKNELLGTINATVNAMRDAGARRHGQYSEHWTLSFQHLGTGPGWAIVWYDQRNGGIDPIVRLGDNKRQAQETCWNIISVLGAIPSAEKVTA
jgi:hypothetical protein